MGRATFRTLDDVQHRGGNLRVTCPKCGRSGVYSILGIIEYFRDKHWNTSLEVAWEHFRCLGTPSDPGCGHKGARLDVAAPAAPPRAPLPAPIATTPARRRW